jgi:hypothetical protein
MGPFPDATRTSCTPEIMLRNSDARLFLWKSPPKKMNPSKYSAMRRKVGRTLLLALAFAFSVALVQLPLANAAEARANKIPALPVTATVEKVKSDDKPPFVLKLKNDSKDPLEVVVTILLSVMSHNRDKARHVPAHVIPAGQTWTIDGLAALDKVSVAAKGFAPLELEVK